MSAELLTEREERVLEAVVRSYVDAAEPAGSRTVAKRFRLGISPATVRNTMADLEEKGFLYHPHTSAGRIPTDRAYRYYVDTLMRPQRLTTAEHRRLRRELGGDAEGMPALERLIRHAVQVLGLLTGELGLASAPRLNEAVLERLELVAVSADKVLLVLALRSGVVRTVYVDLPMSVPADSLVPVAMVLNERLAGRTLSEIRMTLPERLRDAAPSDDEAATELLNIFLQSAEELFAGGEIAGDELHLGRTSVLANQPEFATGASLKNLIELTERRDLLSDVLVTREHEATLKITIGAEHPHPELSTFTLITSEYRVGNLTGVLGVIGPTRMPYEKVVSIVDTASSLLTRLLGDPGPDDPPAAGRRGREARA
ncbi:MAG TPA: heat-inducible transcriptional repressor HrcA [Longimicrobiales bacterium]